MFGYGKAFSTDPGSKQIVVTLKTDEKPDKPELPIKGSRTPEAPIMCLIDFSSLQIEVSGSPVILSYELWDEDGEYVITSYTDDSEMVMYLIGLSGTYQLRLTTEGGTYIGYLYL